MESNKPSESWSETESNCSTRTSHSGPILITTKRKNSKKSARFMDHDGDDTDNQYVEITLDVRDDTVLLQNIKGGDAALHKFQQVSQELKRITSPTSFNRVDRAKSGAARALKGLQFMTKSSGGGTGDGWEEVERRFQALAIDGLLPRTRFGQSIGMKDSSEFAEELFDALARRRGIASFGINKAQLREFWEQITDQSFDSRPTCLSFAAVQLRGATSPSSKPTG